jgi:hypothetical protein
MAPEQHLGESPGAAADQFSFCVSLYEALWGERPFQGSTAAELGSSVIAGHVQEPRNGSAPRWLYRVLAKGLRPEPADRYPSMDALLVALARDPARVRRKWLSAGAVLALVAVAAASVVRSRVQSTMCSGAAQKLVGVWDPERRRAVHDALLATEKSFAEGSFLAAARELDKYLGAWTAAHTDACAATRVRGEQSEEVMELRIECLDRRLEEVRALVDVLAHPDEQVAQRAPQAVASLPGLDECKNADALRQVVPPPATPQAHQRVVALRSRLAEADALRNAGRYAPALKLAESVAGDARQLGYAPVLTEALILGGVIEGITGLGDAAVNSQRCYSAFEGPKLRFPMPGDA